MTDQPTDRLVHAPWNAEQVTALNAFQHTGRMHPFTCGAEHASGQSPMLVATNSGWVCPDPQCTYRQDWAHAFMAQPAVPVSSPPSDQTADRAAVLLWAADQIDAETRQAKADGVLEPDKFRPCRDASAQLRALAGCQECASGLEHDVHCPTPESHNWGCGCPTDPVPADGPSRLAAEAQQPDTETRP